MSPKRRSELTVEIALLGFLRTQAMHGYEIHRCLSDPKGLNGLWRIKLSRLYAILSRLEAEGYVTAQTEPQGDRPPRRVFSLIPAGQAAYLTWLAMPVSQPRDIRLELMLKLYFARLESRETVLRLIAAQQTMCARWLAGPLVGGGATVAEGHSAVIYRYRRGQIEATSAWLAWLADELAQGDQ